MIDGLLFDKDGTLFDFRVSWGSWAQGFLAQIARDAAHTARLGRAIGFDPTTGSFAPNSPVIAATAADIAAALAPELPGLTVADLTNRIDASAANAPMSEAVPLMPLLSALRARGLRLGVATNDSEAPARQHLLNHGITDCFDFIAVTVPNPARECALPSRASLTLTPHGWRWSATAATILRPVALPECGPSPC